MRLFLAIFFPFVVFFTIKRPIAGIICLLLQITLIGWLPAAIWAVYALSQYKTDKKIEQALANAKTDTLTDTEDDKASGTASKKRLFAVVAGIAAVVAVASFLLQKPEKDKPSSPQVALPSTKPAVPAVEAPKVAEGTPKASPAPTPVTESAPAPASEPKVSEAAPAAPAKAKPKAAPSTQVAKPTAPKSPAGNDGDQKAAGTTVRYMKL